MQLRNFDTILETVWRQKLTFGVAFLSVFLTSYGALYALDWLPEPVAASENIANATAQSVSEVATSTDESDSTSTDPVPQVVRDPLPNRLYIDELDRDVQILNPTSRTVADLDAALREGLVRHPDSATLAHDANMFILGHSSYLPNVMNRNYQALNGIQKLEWGDTIRITSDDTEYIYRVEKVYQAKASALTVPVLDTGKMLTLATCDSFGTKDDRHIVEATLSDTRPL